MCEQVSSDSSRYHSRRSPNNTKVDTAPKESFGVVAEKETDLKMKRLFRPR
jgi:hypothetical protein